MRPPGELTIMVKRMLVDASHAEETRVVVANGTRLEEFDFESEERKQLKGNIYLAKVMRVEPSLQAAFIDYGGNRHGFLPFSEIHPDYYQIPVEDREALFREQEKVSELDDHYELEDNSTESANQSESTEPETTTEIGNKESETSFNMSSTSNVKIKNSDKEEVEINEKKLTTENIGLQVPSSKISEPIKNYSPQTKRKPTPGDVEEVGGDETDDIERRRTSASRSLLGRRYKIQEVIKKRQILLVQVVKEERGNKGAALTTYLSLAGRYCVLMPNAIRGGGISRKITSQDDRKRLKIILAELNVPTRMGVIVRTAGTARSKAEIRRDFEYLTRQWEKIREHTLNSIAPDLIYEEGNLIKRSIRDLYTRDVDEILVDGEDGYRVAKDFMRMLIPSHTSKVQPYKDRIPLFARYQIEGQLDSMYSPEVKLKSGGYLVINSTEALVAIDVNSGRATRERNIEETAVKTNLEAASEVARQLRLRDLAGLIVVDFIDMDGPRNQRSVERKLKEAMRVDRARIQIGRISPFGLLEMSRQRLRPSLSEASMEICSSCGGTGIVRSIGSSAVHVLRAIEEEGLRNRSASISVTLPAQVAYYILNNKRRELARIEEICDFTVSFVNDPSMVPPMHSITRTKTTTVQVRDSDIQKQDKQIEKTENTENNIEKGNTRRKRRRDHQEDAVVTEDKNKSESINEEKQPASQKSDIQNEDDESKHKKRRRRGKRGGRRKVNAAPNNFGESTVNNGSDNNDNKIQKEPNIISSEDKKPLKKEVSIDKVQSIDTTKSSIGKTKNLEKNVKKAINSPRKASETKKPKRTRVKSTKKEPNPKKLIGSKDTSKLEVTNLSTVKNKKKNDPVKEDSEDKAPSRKGWWQRNPSKDGE